MATGNDNSVTVIGESVQVRGNLSGDEDLHVLGRVEGSLELDRTLVVAESGVVKAEVSVRNAIVSGIVVGNIHASESVEITREGRMVGDVAAPRLIIVDGASFRGNVDMGDIENMPSRPPRKERPTPAPLPKPEPKAEEPEEEEEEEEEIEEAPPPPKAKPAPTRRPVAMPAAKAKVEKKDSGGKKKKKKPAFLNPPKAKGLPKKQKKRVVVKRR
jgi:cytoskeletal protein CcmA (bactofilin family)